MTKTLSDIANEYGRTPSEVTRIKKLLSDLKKYAVKSEMVLLELATLGITNKKDETDTPRTT